MAYMDYLTRDKMAKTNLQVLTTFDWDFKITPHKPGIVYMPDHELIRVRTTGISGCNPIPDVSIMDVNLRGYMVQQPGLCSTVPQPISIQLQDFEDQALTAWMINWLMKMNNLDNLASYRREDLFCDIEIYQLNSSRVPVHKFLYYNCLPQNPNGNLSDFGPDKNPLGMMAINIKAESYKHTLLNT